MLNFLPFIFFIDAVQRILVLMFISFLSSKSLPKLDCASASMPFSTCINFSLFILLIDLLLFVVEERTGIFWNATCCGTSDLTLIESINDSQITYYDMFTIHMTRTKVNWHVSQLWELKINLNTYHCCCSFFEKWMLER